MITTADITCTKHSDAVYAHLSVTVNRSVERFQFSIDPEILAKAESELRAMLWEYIYGDLEADLQALYDRIGRERIARADVLAGLEAVIAKVQAPAMEAQS